MDFFSGLKKAYDSLGEEITKTFDSSQTGEDGGTTSPREEGDLSSSSTAITTAVPRSPEPAASGTIAVGDQSSVYATPSAVSQQQNVPQHTDEDGGWGQWENQPLMSPARKTKILTGKSSSSLPNSPRGGSPSSSLDHGQGHPLSKTQQIQPTSVSKPGESGSGLQTSGGGSSTQPKSPLATSTPAKSAGKSQLDSLSKEDLIKYVRKQAQILQKSKTRCDELSKENEKLKALSKDSTDGQTTLPSGGGATSSNDGLMEELQVVRSERDRAVRVEKTLRQSVAMLEQEKEELSDHHKVLQEAHGKLKAFCQQQQGQLEEAKKSSSGEEEMKLNNVLTELEREKENAKQLRSKLSSLENQLSQCQLDKERETLELKEANKVLSEENFKLEETTKKLKDKVGALSGEVDSNRIAFEGDVKSLKVENERMKDDLSDLKNKLSEAMEKLNTEREASARWETEATGMKTKNSQLEEMITSKDTAIEGLSYENTQMKESCRKFDDQVKGLEGTVRELNGQLEVARREREEEKERTRENSSQFERERSELNKQLDELKSEAESTKSKLEQLKERNQELENNVDAIQGENDSLRKQVSKLGHSVQELERDSQAQSNEGSEATRQLKEAESMLKERETELETVKGQLGEHESKLKSQTSVMDDLLKKNKELLSSVESVRNENEGLRNQISDLNRSMEQNSQNQSAEYSELAAQLGESESRLKERETELELVQSELEKFKCSVGEHESKENLECELLRSREIDLKSNLATFENELNSLQVKHNMLEKECEQLKIEREEAGKSLTVKLDLAQEQVEAIQSEKDNLSQQVVEGKRELEKVCEERDKLKQSVGEQTASHKEESKKLKAFILKMKKELSEARERESGLKEQLEGGQFTATSEVESLKNQLQQLTVTMETQQQSLDERKAEADCISELEKHIAVLEAKLDSRERELVNVEKKLGNERDEASTKLQQLSETHEVLLSEMASVHSDLATANSQANTHKLASEKTLSDLQSLREELSRERKCLEETRQKLAATEKELKSSAVMNLELEDYQRSMRSLEEQLSSRQDELERVRKEGQLQQDSMVQLKKELESLDQQRSQSEETVTKLKQLLMRNKKELGESKRREGELQQAVEELHSKMEAEKQTAESAKVEISQMAAKIQSLQSQSESSVETLHRTIRSLEHKLGVTQGELSSAQSALAQSQQDYEQYKVRVHSVLKQKSSAPAQSDATAELKQQYESELGRIQSELRDTKDHLSSTLADHEELLVEHDQLASRHEQLLRESEEAKENMQRQLKTEEARHSIQRQEQSELISQLRQEIEDVTNAFKNQLHSLQEDHHKVVSGLKEELNGTQVKLNRLQHEADAKVLARAANHNGGNRQGGGGRGAVGVAGNNVPTKLEIKAPPVELRSSGEGMDQSELDSSFPPTPLSREDSTISFERLLSAAESEQTTEKLSANEVKLYKQLKAGVKKIEHLTELLRESEASSVRLGDQAKLLKEEIRRLERNQEREQGVSNLEYLKNVVLKFLHTQGPERSGLIPIVTKLLQLSPQEIKFLQETVKGNEVDLPGAGGEDNLSGGKKGWTGYLHRWTGY